MYCVKINADRCTPNTFVFVCTTLNDEAYCYAQDSTNTAYNTALDKQYIRIKNIRSKYYRTCVSFCLGSAVLASGMTMSVTSKLYTRENIQKLIILVEQMKQHNARHNTLNDAS